MVTNFKLYFSYLLLNFDFLFIKNAFKNDKNLTLLVSPEILYFLALHIKLSTLFYSSQLVELFAYELPAKPNQTNRLDELVVYNFHSLFNQYRFFIFVCRKVDDKTLKSSLFSITELYNNANWLEREAAELNAVFFLGKKDLRNLMLQYGDKTAPFQKSFPSVGTKEIFYDVTSDFLIQLPVTLQF